MFLKANYSSRAMFFFFRRRLVWRTSQQQQQQQQHEKFGGLVDETNHHCSIPDPPFGIDRIKRFWILFMKAGSHGGALCMSSGIFLFFWLDNTKISSPSL